MKTRLLLVALAACLLVSPASAADPKGELRVAIPWTPETLDPTMNLSSIRAAVGISIFDSLVGRAGDGRPVPELAESWKLLDDTTWQLKLRRHVLFHDGEPFNADAVRFTVQRVLDPNQKSPNRANIAEIVRVDVLDDYTVNLVTRLPYAPLLNRLIDFPIVPPKYTAEKSNQGLALRPVGTGPYRFVELVKDERLVVEGFDRHWRGVPRIPRIVFKPIPEPFTRAAALRNGEVDVITTVPPTLARELERVAGIRVHRVPSTWQIYLGLNAFRKPLSDIRVRQALNYATDVEAIVKSVLDGNRRRMAGPFTPSMFGYDPAVRGYAPDTARARRLLADAGYPDGLEITLESSDGRYQGDKEVAEALGGPMQDADELYNLVSSKGRGLYYKNERVDQFFDLGRGTVDPAKHRAVYSDLARTMVEEATWVFLLQQVDIYATRERLDWTPRADQWMSFHQATLR